MLITTLLVSMSSGRLTAAFGGGITTYQTTRLSSVVTFVSLRDILEESRDSSGDGYFRAHSDAKDRSTSYMSKKQEKRSQRREKKSLVDTERGFRPTPSSDMPEYAQVRNHRDVGDVRDPMRTSTSMSPTSLVQSEGRTRPIPSTKLPEYAKHTNHRSAGDTRTREKTNLRKRSLASISLVGTEGRMRPVPAANVVPEYANPRDRRSPGDSGDMRNRPVPRFADADLPPGAEKPSTSSPPASSLETVKSATPLVDVIAISDSYDSGNGEFVSARIIDDVDDDFDLAVNVKIKPDPYTDLEQKQHFQSFNFRSILNHNSKALKGIFSGQTSIKVKYILENAGEASYSDAFKGYSTFVSTKANPFDPESWIRTSDCEYENGQLTWSHVHSLKDGPSSAYFSYFPPYSYERHLYLVSKCEEAKGSSIKSLGQTALGKGIDYITVGNGPRVCWIIHRQHPGESMASFYSEGLLNRLLGLDGKWDKVGEKARELYTFYIVPNINPDGSASGYLRTNAVGSNLNREWCPSPAPLEDNANEKGSIYEAPSLGRSPEVYHILNKMDKTGCDAFLDIHGDEELPFNFLAGSEGMSVWGKRLESLHGAFLASYERANPDMQAKVSYDCDGPGLGMKNVCSNQIAERFNCFSGTLEMPFKELHGRDNDGKIGWGPARAKDLGASVLNALCYIQPYLRDDEQFWESLPEEDAYPPGFWPAVRCRSKN